MSDFLPSVVIDALKHVNRRYLYEIRLRAGKPATINYGGEYRYLGQYGVTDRRDGAICLDEKDIEDTVYRAGKFSVYSVEEQIRRGFITAEGGERIGLAGEYVIERGSVVTVRNITSLCIRIPHEIFGCADKIFENCLQDGLCNLLIASVPGLGKTTILRDLAATISRRTAKNILVCDERGEISAFDTGESTDVLKFADKETAFEAGIRAMRPDLMITDELTAGDCAAVQKVIRGGVYVIASAHFSKKEAIVPPFLGLFDRYILLDDKIIGKISAMYDRDIKELRVT